jgi:hypothetical protein
MHRKLKVFGVALVALFALGAIASSSALAAEGLITPGVSNATITASQIGKIVTTIGSAGSRKQECSTVHFDSTTTTSVAGSSNVILGMEYKNCIDSPGGGPAVISTTNCDFNFTATSSTSKEGSIILESKSSVSERCDLSIVDNSTAGSRNCEYTIPNQSATGSFKYASVAGSPSSDVVISFNTTQMSINVLFGTLAACGASAGNSTIKKFSGELTVTAEVKVSASEFTATSLVVS